MNCLRNAVEKFIEIERIWMRIERRSVRPALWHSQEFGEVFNKETSWSAQFPLPARWIGWRSLSNFALKVIRRLQHFLLVLTILRTQLISNSISLSFGSHSVSLSLSGNWYFLKEFDNLGIWEQVIFFSVTFRRNMGCRDSWVGWVLLTQMDWLWIWFTSSIESLCWFEFSCSHHPSTVSKQTQFSGNAFVLLFLLDCHFLSCLKWFCYL